VSRRLLEGAAAAGGAIVFAAIFGAPLLSNLNSEGAIWDWDLFRLLTWVPYQTLAHFHQMPRWDPYICGGLPILGDPEVGFLSPLFVFPLLFGPVAGLHLEVLAHLALAWAGGYFLARVVGQGYLGAITCATVFAGSSWFFLHLAVGHLPFLPYTYMPWVVAFAWLSLERRQLSYSVVAGAILALIFYEGGFYATFHGGLLVGLLMISVTVGRRDWWPLCVAFMVALLAAGFAAIKLLPGGAFALAHPRPTSSDEYLGFHNILIALFSRQQDIFHYLVGLGFFECGAYIGIFFGALWWVGALGAIRRCWPWLAATAALLLIAIGNFGPYSPWVWLHGLPMLSSQRIVARFLIPLVLCVAVVAGYGVDLARTIKPPWGMIAALVILLAGTIDAWLISPPNLGVFAGNREPQLVPKSAQFRQFRSPESPDYTQNMMSMVHNNVGVLTCYRYFPVASTALGYNERNYRGEQFLAGPGRVSMLRWTPNRLDYEVNSPAPVQLIVNQNYDRGWRLAEGRGEVVEHHGLLAVQVPAGQQRLELAYRDSLALLGLVVVILTFIVGMVIAIYERYHRRVKNLPPAPFRSDIEMTSNPAQARP
jgi:hypothetical protein